MGSAWTSLRRDTNLTGRCSARTCAFCWTSSVADAGSQNVITKKHVQTQRPETVVRSFVAQNDRISQRGGGARLLILLAGGSAVKETVLERIWQLEEANEAL